MRPSRVIKNITKRQQVCLYHRLGYWTDFERRVNLSDRNAKRCPIAMLPVSVLNICCDFVDYSIEVDLLRVFNR